MGNFGAGKTTLCRAIHFMDHPDFQEIFFDKNIPKSTIGAEFTSVETYTNEDEKEKIRLELWDTAGQERYRALVPLYFRNADIFLLVFDIN